MRSQNRIKSVLDKSDPELCLLQAVFSNPLTVASLQRDSSLQPFATSSSAIDKINDHR